MICSRRPRNDLPLDRLRDRVLFGTAYVCGARASDDKVADAEIRAARRRRDRATS
ncbi:hypothetical protein AAH991_32400 [Microbispora sp. ZYX-F-249]|uniref:Uncharacterized protein n=1 Tax=Microbispora maris TaxID=3144104 RepID=A0ABV0AX63_9ACTN